MGLDVKLHIDTSTPPTETSTGTVPNSSFDLSGLQQGLIQPPVDDSLDLTKEPEEWIVSDEVMALDVEGGMLNTSEEKAAEIEALIKRCIEDLKKIAGAGYSRWTTDTVIVDSTVTYWGNVQQGEQDK